MPRPPVSFKERDHVVEVRLDRPASGNRLDEDLAAELMDVLSSLRGRSDIRCVLLTAAGRDFSVGAGSIPTQSIDRAGRGIAEALASLRLPTIAAIRGRAVGSGLEIALACDVRIVADDARLSIPQARAGSLPSAGGTQRLPRLIGHARAFEMLCLGTVVRGDEAVRIGLASRSGPADQVDVLARQVATEFASQAPIAVQYAKEAILAGLDLPIAHGLRLELDLAILLQSTDDRREGLAAFRERRRPTMRGT